MRKKVKLLTLVNLSPPIPSTSTARFQPPVLPVMVVVQFKTYFTLILYIVAFCQLFIKDMMDNGWMAPANRDLNNVYFSAGHF